MRWTGGFGPALLTGGVVIASALFWTAAGPSDAARAQAPASEPSGSSTIHALARLEPAGGVVTVGARPGARVVRIEVKEGDEVKAGQLLATLEGQEAARAQLASAETQKKKAEADRDRQRKRLSLERAHEDRVQKVRLQQVTEIQKILAARVTQGDASQLLIDKVPGITAKDKAEFQVGLDRLKIDAARAAIELEQAKADQDDLAPRRAIEDQALATGGPEDALLDQQIELARANVEQTQIKAPTAGHVLQILAREGEVSARPARADGRDLTSMVATAGVDQSDVGAILPGASAEVRSPAAPCRAWSPASAASSARRTPWPAPTRGYLKTSAW
ncbi:MAG: biotin/lipoyl-binding protein [Isosphaeraceae bacterium]